VCRQIALGQAPYEGVGEHTGGDYKGLRVFGIGGLDEGGFPPGFGGGGDGALLLGVGGSTGRGKKC
jgi:hypothetical protein